MAEDPQSKPTSSICKINVSCPWRNGELEKSEEEEVASLCIGKAAHVKQDKMPMFTATLSTKAKRWKKLKCSSTVVQKDEMVKFIETENRMVLLGWGGRMGSHYLTGTESQFCKMRVLYSGYIMMQCI